MDHQFKLFTIAKPPQVARAPVKRGEYQTFTRELVLVLIVGEPEISVQAIAASLEVSVRHVQRCIADLKSDGEVFVTRVGRGRSRMPTDLGYARLRRAVVTLGHTRQFPQSLLPLYGNLVTGIEESVAYSARAYRKLRDHLLRVGFGDAHGRMRSRTLRYFAPCVDLLVRELPRVATRRVPAAYWMKILRDLLVGITPEDFYRGRIRARLAAVDAQAQDVFWEHTRGWSDKVIYYAACAVAKAQRRYKRFGVSDVRGIADWCHRQEDRRLDVAPVARKVSFVAHREELVADEKSRSFAAKFGIAV